MFRAVWGAVGVAACLCLLVGLVSGARSSAQTLPAGYDHFTSAVTVYADGSNVVVQANAIPDHGSPYFPINDPRYEADGDPTFMQNPNQIAQQTIEFRIPVSPQEATTHVETPLGPIGVAVNGVPLFNQYAGPNHQPLTVEISSFDQYDGHPQQTDIYHYHREPYALTAVNGKDSLIGYLLDGFPVYGPVENGMTLTSADLDQYHGHFGPTPDYPQGIYHYNITADAPYIAGAGFYGTPGTVSYSFSSTPTPEATDTATATAAPTATSGVPSVGGFATLPDLPPRAPSGATTTSRSHTMQGAGVILAALTVLLAVGRYTHGLAAGRGGHEGR